ncbi:MAG: NFACT RNA binding domain-containing protein [Candidatus Aenigmatarchaeota archaeon]
MPLTPIDFRYLAEELSLLERAVLKNITREENIAFEFKCADKKARFLVAGKGFCFLTEKKPAGEPDGFCNFLLNHLKKKRLEFVRQQGFNKALEIGFGDYSLVLEFIGKGNIILCDSGRTITGALIVRELRDRKILPKEKYAAPESPDLSKFETETDEKALATGLHIGQEFAREIVKTGTPITKFLGRPTEPGIYENGKKFVTPFRLKSSALNFGPKKSLSEAIEELYSKKAPEKKDIILAQQEKNLGKRKKEVEKYELEATLLFANFECVERAVEIWRAEKRAVPPLKEVNEKAGEAVLGLEGSEIRLPLAGELRKTVNLYFSRAKKAKEKIEKTKEWQEKKIEPKKDKKKMKAKAKAEWFGQFRNFRTSDGFLVILGKDATTNEKLIKKYCKPKDIVLHAHIPGSPFAVIRSEGREVTEAAIREAAQFTAGYSRFWNSRLGIADIYWIYPEQASKTPRAGEYLAKGSFMIHGKKNFLKAELRIGIGVNENFEVVRGTEDSLKKHAKYFVLVVPGEKSGRALGQEIRERLAQKAKGEDKEEILRINPEEFLKFVPYGKGEIIAKKS